jgi:hypothetical protein
MKKLKERLLKNTQKQKIPNKKVSLIKMKP